MKKKILICLAVVVALFMTGCVGAGKDASKFKEEYESLNGKQNSSKEKMRDLEIDSKNPMEYATAKDIVDKIKNKETFYVYFGSAYCPWCRSVIEKAVEVSIEKKIKTIYYVDIWDGDHKEKMRDVYKLSDEGALELVTKSSKDYDSLIESLGDVLEEYTLIDETDGSSVSFGRKRIFAPTFIYVEKGKAKRMVDGISIRQKEATEKLTKDMLNDEQKTFEDFFKA